MEEEENCTIFLRWNNIYYINDKDLDNIFQIYGDIVRKRTFILRGYAFIIFSNSKEARSAVEKKYVIHNGIKIFIIKYDKNIPISNKNYHERSHKEFHERSHREFRERSRDYRKRERSRDYRKYERHRDYIERDRSRDKILKYFEPTNDPQYLNYLMYHQPFSNQPFSNQPFSNQPFSNQPFSNQPLLSNQSFSNQPLLSNQLLLYPQQLLPQRQQSLPQENPRQISYRDTRLYIKPKQVSYGDI